MLSCKWNIDYKRVKKTLGLAVKSATLFAVIFFVIFQVFPGALTASYVWKSGRTVYRIFYYVVPYFYVVMFPEWISDSRCADQILADREDVLRVFIYADMDKRVQRGIQEYGKTQVIEMWLASFSDVFLQVKLFILFCYLSKWY